jgi:hypothetical protein
MSKINEDDKNILKIIKTLNDPKNRLPPIPGGCKKIEKLSNQLKDEICEKVNELLIQLDEAEQKRNEIQK